MNEPTRLAIAGTGSAVPQRVVTNADFAARLDTSDEWIRTRSGIKERRWVSPGEGNLSLTLEASQKALEDASMTGADIDLIIVGTVTPEYPVPGTAPFLQDALGARGVPACDINAGCSGFLYAFNMAAAMIHGGSYKTALVVGVETLSRITDMEDRTTCVLFGDGAGATILTRSDDPNQQLLFSTLGAYGDGAKLIWQPGGGSAEPASTKTVNERLHYLKMKGREVYKFAVTKMVEVVHEASEHAGITPKDLALVIPHQSNQRIIESAREKLGLTPEQMMVNIDRYGNTSSASVAICLDEARREGRIKHGDLVLMAAFGAGLTWASALLRL